MKKFLDQDFSGAALAEFKREVSGAVTSIKIMKLLQSYSHLEYSPQ